MQRTLRREGCTAQPHRQGVALVGQPGFGRGATLGQLMVDEPPYVLEVLFNDPVPCWCRLDLLPDAGATTVSLTVAGLDNEPAPDPEFIRDLWVAALNELD